MSLLGDRSLFYSKSPRSLSITGEVGPIRSDRGECTMNARVLTGIQISFTHSFFGNLFGKSMARNPKVTLREIAEEAGVSRMAVSLSLRGKSGVSEKTRAKVRKAAEKLGYQPDPEVGKLMARIRAGTHAEIESTLALLTSGPSPDTWKKYVTERKYVEGCRNQAKKYGYLVEEFWLNDPELSNERLSKIIWSRGIEGVIIAPIQGRLGDVDSRSLDFDFDLFSAVEISGSSGNLVRDFEAEGWV